MGERLFSTTAPGMYGKCGSGKYFDLLLTFPLAAGQAVAKELIIQLSERDTDWTPRDLVGTYWGSFMQVTVTADHNNIDGPLLGLRAPTTSTPPLVNVCNLLNILQHLDAPFAGKVLANYLTLLEELLEEPWDNVDDDLKDRPPRWGKVTDVNFYAAREKQDTAMMKKMDAFKTLADMKGQKRWKDHKGEMLAVKVLRKGE
jgi:hypothetical protein